MKTNYVKRTLILCLGLIFTLIYFTSPANAGYSTGLKSQTIEITSPDANGLKCDGEISLAGLSKLDRVWFCLRGPNGEVVIHPADVEAGRFHLTIQLRFGPGTYTVWAGDNQSKFDGVIRFQVINRLERDTRYTSPSAYIDSDNPDVVALAGELTGPEMSDMEKLQAIHGWVTKNLAYDYQSYLAGNNQLVPASQTLNSKKGMCRDFSFVVAALARAAGLQARVVYGQAQVKDGWAPQDHAWNEVFADCRWVVLDATWNSGFVKNGVFVPAPSTKFFDPDTKQFSETHLASSYTLH